MFLSAVWTLILTAPIHCRASIAEQVMQCYVSSNLMKKQTLHLGLPEYIFYFSLNTLIICFNVIMLCLNHLKYIVIVISVSTCIQYRKLWIRLRSPCNISEFFQCLFLFMRYIYKIRRFNPFNPQHKVERKEQGLESAGGATSIAAHSSSAFHWSTA